MTVETEFIDFSAAKLEHCMERIEHCVAQVSPAQIWDRASDNENSMANLLLHLRGNIRQWILCGIGGAPDTRDRDAEFAAHSGDDGMKLAAELRAAVAEVNVFLRALPAARLLERTQTQGYETTVLAAIYHVVEHFTGHTFQIIFMTKRFTGRDLGFYAHLKEPQAAGGPTIP